MEAYFKLKTVEEIIGVSIFFLVIIGFIGSVLVDKIAIHKRKRKK